MAASAGCTRRGGALGVVLCGTVGFEKQVFHRAWRYLADRLAASGHPTIRFDLPGSGDSLGEDLDPDALEAWLGSIQAASSWLRAHTGARRVALCGMHLGGLLATAAAAQIADIDRAVLIAPVLSGRSYARMLSASAKLAGGAPATPCANDVVEAFGLRLHETTLQGLRALDLARLPPPAPRTLILTPGDPATLETVSASWSAAGSDLVVEPMDDYLALTRPAHESSVPFASLDRVCAWLDVAAENGEAAPARPIPVAELRTERTVELPVLLDRPGHPDARLFGLFCRATDPVRGPAMLGPAVLICNTGANPHYGYGRLAVALARALARDGVASLRVDLGGLGDSDGATTVSLPDLYADRSFELRAAIDCLARRGHADIVVFGICTGAFHAMHAGLVDDRVRGVVLVNQLVYRWRAGAVLLRATVLVRTIRARVRGEQAPDPEQEMLRLRIAPPNPTTNRIRRIGLRAAVLAEAVALTPFGFRSAAREPFRMFGELRRRGVSTLVVAGTDDYARAVLQGQFGTTLDRLRRAGTRVEIEDRFDHPVGQSAARSRLIALVRDFMAEMISTATAPAEAEEGPRRQPARN